MSVMPVSGSITTAAVTADPIAVTRERRHDRAAARGIHRRHRHAEHVEAAVQLPAVEDARGLVHADRARDHEERADHRDEDAGADVDEEQLPTRRRRPAPSVSSTATPVPANTAMKLVIATPPTWRHAAFGDSSTVRAASRRDGVFARFACPRATRRMTHGPTRFSTASVPPKAKREHAEDHAVSSARPAARAITPNASATTATPTTHPHPVQRAARPASCARRAAR